LNLSLSAGGLLRSAAFVGLNFPNLLLPAAAYGILRAGSLGVPRVACYAMLAELAVIAGFVLRYPVVDQYTFFLPMYVVFSIFGGVGLAALEHAGRRRIRSVGLAVAWSLLVATPGVYAFAPELARRWNVLGDLARHKPYRDDYEYLFTPWSFVEDSAERLSRHAVELAGEHGLILVEDRFAEPAIRYRLLREGRSEVAVTQDPLDVRIREAARTSRPIVLVPARTDGPRPAPPPGSWQRAGNLYVWASP
jgi:hypothetical protein